MILNAAEICKYLECMIEKRPDIYGCLYWDDKVIAFRGRTPRARSAESCCGADIVQAYAAPYPKWMISKVLGAHRKNRKVSRVLQIAVKKILIARQLDYFKLH